VRPSTKAIASARDGLLLHLLVVKVVVIFRRVLDRRLLVDMPWKLPHPREGIGVLGICPWYSKQSVCPPRSVGKV
jgi:hypothetical protein